MDYERVHLSLKKMIDLNNRLGAKSEYKGKDAEVFEELIGLREEILDLFGLPYTVANISILDNLERESGIQNVIARLQNIAREYLLSVPRTDEELLTYLEKGYLTAFDVLAELKITIHHYTLFLCELLFTGRNISKKDILTELNIIKNNKDVGLLNDIGIMAQNVKDYNLLPDYSTIKKYNLRYLELYMESVFFKWFEKTPYS